MSVNEFFSEFSQRDIVKVRNALNEIYSYYDIPNETKIEKIHSAKKFLEYSDNDINAATALYNLKIYPNALYSLQQSVEKISKAYATGFFFFDKKEVRKVGHQSPMAFIKLIEKFKVFLTNIDVALYKTGIINPDNVDIKNFNANKYAKLFNRSAKDIARMKADEMSHLLKTGQTFTDMMSKTDFRETIREQLSSMKSSLEIDENIKEKEQAIEYIDTTLDKLDDVVFENYYIYLPELYILGIITYPHENETRYPDMNMGIDEYNEELSIVQKFDEIFSRVVFFRNKLDQMFDNELEVCGYNSMSSK